MLCMICNTEFKSITGKHLAKHGMSVSDYKTLYGDVVSNEYRELKRKQSTGEKNGMCGKRHTTAAKKRMSLNRSGKPAHNKNTPMSDAQKKLLSDKAVIRNEVWHRSNTHPIVGQKRSNETKTKIRKARQRQVITAEHVSKAIQTKKDKGYDLAFFRGRKHSDETKEKIINSTARSRAKRKKETEKFLLEFAVSEGFVVNDIIDDITWNVTCPSCKRVFDITRQYFNPSKYRGRRCVNCDNHSYVSVAENDIYQFIKHIAPDAEQTNRSVLDGQELDIYIPSLKLAIEYCGLYWHSEDFKDKKYHLDKLVKSRDRGIRLITIFEDEWHSSPDIVKSILHSIIGNNRKIYARCTTVKEISSQTLNIFLNTNHLQGSGRSNVRYGLYHGDELVSVMSFSNNNISRRGAEWEINRYCSKMGITIVGGASKLFKAFLKHKNPNKVITFADKRWSMGKVYEQMGFEFDSHTPINYWYWKPNEFTRYHRYALRKNSDDDQSLTEWQNRQLQGWKRIWDCGNLKYVWES